DDLPEDLVRPGLRATRSSATRVIAMPAARAGAGVAARRGSLARWAAPHPHLRARRTTSLSPDHTSETAQTFTSTNPSGRASSRITSSVISVGTPDDFFGHETQTGVSAARRSR